MPLARRPKTASAARLSRLGLAVAGPVTLAAALVAVFLRRPAVPAPIPAPSVPHTPPIGRRLTGTTGRFPCLSIL
ncbi:hypothetical protein KRM28CT15_59530 [Krasilnikovia sp. M28-CT-15]